jgi:hypothetical protein
MENPCQPNLDLPKTLNSTHLGPSHLDRIMGKRATLQPKLDFVVLPLIPTTIDAIERAIRSKIAFGGYRGIIHAQIETNGRLAFAAYDNFHKDCVYAGTQVSSEFLDRLLEAKVLRSYQRVRQPSAASRI